MPPRRPHRSAAAAVLFALTASALLPAPAGADPIADKQAEAVRVERELEELGVKASEAVENYREAESALADANAQVAVVRERLSVVEHDYRDTLARVRRRVVAIYQGRTSPTPLVFMDAKNLQDAAIRFHYASLVAQQDREVVDDLAVARDSLHEQEGRLSAARDEALRHANELRAGREEAEQAVARQKALFDQVKGELAALVAAEGARRRAEEERRAREEAARRQAAAERARRARSAAPGGTPAVAAPAPHPQAQKAVDTAMAQIGKPYRWGANGPDSFDCSGLTSYAWAAAGVSIPRSSRAQYAGLPHVGMEQLAPGDLVFYGSPIHHVGMFIGNGQMVNAPYTGEAVRVDSIYRLDFAGAARPA